MKRCICILTPLMAAGIAGSAAADITVTIENTNASDGFFLTPFWVAAHNGGFDSYDGGTLASLWPGLTELAEEGNTGPLSDAFTASAAGMAGGVQATLLAISEPGDAPVLNPGEKVTMNLDVGDATVNRYFSYASMVIPTNDLFVANGNPTAHQIFDADGNFRGPFTINIFGSAVNDNGTEVNDAFGGAAFSANGGDGVDENVNIRNFFTDPGDQGYLDSFIGTDTVTGLTIGSSFGPDDLIARITIVPAPGPLCALVLAGLVGRRRRMRQ